MSKGRLGRGRSRTPSTRGVLLLISSLVAWTATWMLLAQALLHPHSAPLLPAPDEMGNRGQGVLVVVVVVAGGPRLGGGIACVIGIVVGFLALSFVRYVLQVWGVPGADEDRLPIDG